MFDSSDFRDEIFIVKTLLRLPEDIREKVLREVSFILMHGETATIKKCLHILMNRQDLKSTESKDEYVANFKRTFIILNFKDIKDWDKMDVIAYDIARFIAGSQDPQSYDKDYEEKARAIAEEWGFEKKSQLKNYRKIH